jgi:AraC-like DNA-binding protein
MLAGSNLHHHIRALPPAIKAMQQMGFTPEQCLRGTGLKEQDLLIPDAQPLFTLEQQFNFHRNLLHISGDSLLGLKLGKAYNLNAYGLFGYAFLSAPTLRQALMIVRNYGPLTFTLSQIDFKIAGATASLQFSSLVDIPKDLQVYYADRDLSASVFGGEAAMPSPLQPLSISLAHRNHRHRSEYQEFFGAPVTFGASLSELTIDTSTLDAPMPARDPETSGLLQQQCELLLARMSESSGFVDEVRQIIVARPGYFPDIDYIAEKLNITSRTLRRKLNAEGSNYQHILDEVRYQLAREYLSTSGLPLEEISSMLGYSSAGNFTHAFKRWHGSAPRQFRQESR